MKKLKLFVWEKVLCDYTDGVMFAYAPDVETARKLLLQGRPYLPQETLDLEPKVITEPYAFSLYGGG